MPRIATPATIEAAPQAAQPLLQAVKKQLGVVPNMFRAIANSPAALEGYLGLNGALAKGSLEAATRERIALAIAEVNGCNYCASAHTYLGKSLAKLSEDEIAANRDGASTDVKANAAVGFAVRLVRSRGHVSEADLKAVRDAGYTDANRRAVRNTVCCGEQRFRTNQRAGTDCGALRSHIKERRRPIRGIRRLGAVYDGGLSLGSVVRNFEDASKPELLGSGLNREQHSN